MTKYTAILALPHGDMARDAAERISGADEVFVTDDNEAGVWLTWSVTASSDQKAVDALQEIRLRAEMSPEYAVPNAMTPSGDQPSLFQATPLIIVRGNAVVIHSEEVYCI